MSTMFWKDKTKYLDLFAIIFGFDAMIYMKHFLQDLKACCKNMEFGKAFLNKRKYKQCCRTKPKSLTVLGIYRVLERWHYKVLWLNSGASEETPEIIFLKGTSTMTPNALALESNTHRVINEFLKDGITKYYGSTVGLQKKHRR